MRRLQLHRHGAGLSEVQYFLIEPEVAAELGERTDLDRSRHPPGVNRLHLEFMGWLGDSLLETFPVFVVTQSLGDALVSSQFAGFVLSTFEVSISEQFVELYGDRELPDFYWLRVSGRAGVDDFGLANDHRLVISQRALDLIKHHSLMHADILDWSA